ncbi:tyrosine recombinase XerS (plasmid) [Niallia taxi]|uniref:tyrosine recombinase XerS n=1 Tax=Niallia taxi TaxID=2499688 RepID=UPI0011A6C5AC|nr:tyrosine recombinase XerS [Niallia taxi]MDE5052544.1 tyrosine recombinase XerS [Niallia taxi]MED3962911.1 tyrosine recombinase XerS [Niallia taxi]WOD65603.1 tyrosine recombinase XerS [Niallia taxi]
MAITKQHEMYEKRLQELLKEMPYYVVEYVDDKLDIRSPLTLFNYVRDYKEFFSWLLAENIVACPNIKEIPVTALGELPLADVQNYFKFAARKKYKITEKDDITKKISPKTINRQKSALRSLFNYLTLEAEVDGGEPYFHRNVMKKIPIKKVSETFNERAKKITEKIFINDNDVEFLDYIENHYEETLTTTELRYYKRDKERNYAILSLFLGSGIRVNELTSLRLKDVDITAGEISVIRKGGKKDTVSVTPSSLKDVIKYLDVRATKYKAGSGENEYLFIKLYKGNPEPLTNRAVEDIVYKYTKSFDKRMSPHKLRHTYATNLAEHTGGDIPLIMNQLGHTQSDISLLYINTSREKAKMAAELLDKRRQNKDD